MRFTPSYFPHYFCLLIALQTGPTSRLDPQFPRSSLHPSRGSFQLAYLAFDFATMHGLHMLAVAIDPSKSARCARRSILHLPELQAGHAGISQVDNICLPYLYSSKYHPLSCLTSFCSERVRLPPEPTGTTIINMTLSQDKGDFSYPICN